MTARFAILLAAACLALAGGAALVLTCFVSLGVVFWWRDRPKPRHAAPLG